VDDLWLNESFASWRAAKETDERNPSWKWWQSQDADKETAMGADARLSSHAIQQHVVDELQAANAFDPDITYTRARRAADVRSYLGADTSARRAPLHQGAGVFKRQQRGSVECAQRASGAAIGDIGWRTGLNRRVFRLLRCRKLGARDNRECIAAAKPLPAARRRSEGIALEYPLQVRSGINGEAAGDAV